MLPLLNFILVASVLQLETYKGNEREQEETLQEDGQHAGLSRRCGQKGQGADTLPWDGCLLSVPSSSSISSTSLPCQWRQIQGGYKVAKTNESSKMEGMMKSVKDYNMSLNKKDCNISPTPLVTNRVLVIKTRYGKCIGWKPVFSALMRANQGHKA